MRVSEILRQLADLVDETETVAGQEDQGQMPVQAEQPCDQPGATGADITVTHLEPVEVSTDDGSEPATMISPLQQEHELLKKSQGIDNNVAEFAGDDGDDQMARTELNAEEEQPWAGTKKDTEEEQPWASTEKDGSPLKSPGRRDNDEVDEGDADLSRMKKMAGIGNEQKPHNYAEDSKPASVNPRRNAASAFHKSANARSK